MNVLEKILEEIEEKRNRIIDMSDEEPELCDVDDWLAEGEKDGKMKAYQEIKELIRSHMDDSNADTEKESILCTISKDDVLAPYDDTYDVVVHCTNKEDQDKAVNIIKAFNWIPVSERLPGNKASVLICYDNGEIDIGWHDGRNWRTGYSHADIRENVIAWKPAPDPYRPAEE